MHLGHAILCLVAGYLLPETLRYEIPGCRSLAPKPCPLPHPAYDGRVVYARRPFYAKDPRGPPTTDALYELFDWFDKTPDY